MIKPAQLRLAREFLRYAFVGGTAFLVDVGLLYLFKNYVFYSLDNIGVYISAVIGFVGGLVYNYCFSLIFVFDNARENKKGRSVKSFAAFGAIGIAGLLLTEVGMFVGIQIFALQYMLVKLMVSTLVLIWNYGARKILIFR
jgi:putative flippase GtrA